MNEESPAKTPWHLWVVGIVTLLWNSMGVLDFVMTQTKNEAYMSEFTEEQLEFFYGFPMWLVIVWGIAVIGGLLGSLLLLLRNKLAFPVLAASLVAMVTTAIHNFAISNGLEIMGTLGVIFTVVIFTIALLLVLYSARMKANGVLR